MTRYAARARKRGGFNNDCRFTICVVGRCKTAWILEAKRRDMTVEQWATEILNAALPEPVKGEGLFD